MNFHSPPSQINFPYSQFSWSMGLHRAGRRWLKMPNQNFGAGSVSIWLASGLCQEWCEYMVPRTRCAIRTRGYRAGQPSESSMEKRDVIIGCPCPLPLLMPLRDILHSIEIITLGLPESPPNCIFLRTLPSSPTLSLLRSVGASQTISHS